MSKIFFMEKSQSNYDRLLAAIIENPQLVSIGDYNPTDYESIDEALNSDNTVVKALAMFILSGNKSETQIYNEISNFLINNLV